MNVAALARDAGVARQTIAGYVQILHDTLVATTLGAFEAKLRVRERSHPKLYWFDAGIVRALKHQTGTVSPEERGALLEGFVFMLLRFYRERTDLCANMGYWAPREAATTEVDFVLARGKELLAIEVKATQKLRPADLRGLRAIAELQGLVRRVLVFLGPRALKTPDGVDVLPLAEFAKRLQLGTLWP
jgi:predicted AAA+ superfamily ATPase